MRMDQHNASILGTNYHYFGHSNSYFQQDIDIYTKKLDVASEYCL